MKPEVVEELTRKTYCECAPRGPPPRDPRAPHSRRSPTPPPSSGPALHPLHAAALARSFPAPPAPRAPREPPAAPPAPHLALLFQGTPPPTPPGTGPPVSLRGATPGREGKPQPPRGPLSAELPLKGGAVPGRAALVRGGGAWLRGGSGCAEPTGTSAAGWVIHASRCRRCCCEVGLSPPLWPRIVYGGWRDLELQAAAAGKGLGLPTGCRICRLNSAPALISPPFLHMSARLGNGLVPPWVTCAISSFDCVMLP